MTQQKKWQISNDWILYKHLGIRYQGAKCGPVLTLVSAGSETPCLRFTSSFVREDWVTKSLRRHWTNESPTNTRFMIEILCCVQLTTMDGNFSATYGHITSLKLVAMFTAEVLREIHLLRSSLLPLKHLNTSSLMLDEQRSAAVVSGVKFVQGNQSVLSLR